MNYNFNTGDRVYLTGPPKGEKILPGMPFDRETHRLYNVPGTICIGPDGSAEPFAGGAWVKFEEDTQPIRQVDKRWLSREPEINH